MANVIANQTIEKHQYILFLLWSCERAKRFKLTYLPVHRKNEYLTRKYIWPVIQQENQIGNATTTYDRPTHGTTKKIQRTLATQNSEYTKAPSSLFPSEMIAKLEKTKSYCKTKQASNNKPPQTMGATTNNE